MPGINSTGFVTKSAQEIREGIISNVKAKPSWGPGTNFAPNSYMGQLVGAIASSLRDLWDLAQAVYDSFNVDSAEGAHLDNLCKIVGVYRKSASRATGVVRCYGTTGTIIPDFEQSPPGQVSRSADGAIFYVSNNPSGGIGWEISASGYVDVSVHAATAGKLSVDNGQIDTIIPTVLGWDSVGNPATESGKPNLSPFIDGEDIEKDSDLRARRLYNLQAAGSGTDGAIKARIENLVDESGNSVVSAANVISNRTLSTLPSGQPAKSLRVIVLPSGLSNSAKTLILQTIWASSPAGIEIWSGPSSVVEGQVFDVYGGAHNVGFSYGSQVQVYIRCEVVGAATGAEDDIKNAILEATANLSLGDDVVPARITCAITSSIEGVELVKLQISRSSMPGAGTWPSDTGKVSIDSSELATISSDPSYMEVSIT